MDALISIVVPVFGVEEFLARCIDSVLAQTYPIFELILVDDGSPDACPSMCDSYAEKDERVVVIHKANGGLSDARNAGLDRATGAYMYFLDGDDYIEPELLRRAVTVLEREKAEIVSFNYRKVDTGNNALSRSNFPEGVLDLTDDAVRLSYILNGFLQYKNGWEVWSRLYKKDLLRDNAMRFWETSEVIAEDVCFSLIALMHAKKIVAIGDILYNYRIRDDSLYARSVRSFKIPKYIQLARRLEDYVKTLPASSLVKQHVNLISLEIWLHELTKTSYRKNRIQIRDGLSVIDNQYFMTVLESAIKHSRRLKQYRSGYGAYFDIIRALYFYGDSRPVTKPLALPFIAYSGVHFFLVKLRHMKKKMKVVWGQFGLRQF